MIKRLSLIILALFIFVSQSFATDYYVCDSATTCDTGAAGNTDWETGNDGNNGTARGTPWLTADYAMGSGSGVSAGDVVILGKGTYTEQVSVNISGSVGGGYITLKSESPWEATIDGTGTGAAIVLSTGATRSYLIFQDLDITKGSHVVNLNGDESTSNNNIKFINNKIHEATNSADYASCITGGGGYLETVTIDRNEFYDCGDVALPNSQTIGYAIYLSGIDWTITNNVFRDLGDYAGEFIKLDGHHNSVTGSHDPQVSIINNTFSGSSEYGGRNSHVLLVHPGGNTKDTRNSKVLFANNAFHDVAINTTWPPGCTDMAVGLQDSADYNGNVDFYSNRADQKLWCADGERSLTEVDTQDEDQSWTEADFGFTDSGANDYSLAATSSMIDAGNATYAPADDYIGTSRPQELADDIGAYEYTGTPPSHSGITFGKLETKQCEDSCY